MLFIVCGFIGMYFLHRNILSVIVSICLHTRHIYASCTFDLHHPCDDALDSCVKFVSVDICKDDETKATRLCLCLCPCLEYAASLRTPRKASIWIRDFPRIQSILFMECRPAFFIMITRSP